MAGKYGGMEVYIQIFSNSALTWCQRSISRTGRLTPGERIRGSHEVGGWAGPEIRSRRSVQEQHILPMWGIKP
jgi:hypothetical protein